MIDFYANKLASKQRILSGAINLLGGIAKGAAPSDGQTGMLLTGTTAKTIIKTVTLPALQPNSQVRIYYMWSMNNNSNVRTLQLALNGQDIGVTDTRAVADWNDGEIRMQNLNSTSAQRFSTQGVGTHTGAIKNLTVDTSVPTTLTVSGTLSNAGDNMQLQMFQVQIINPV